MSARMKAIGEASITWAQDEPPRIRGPWEDAIVELAERGDPRFRRILAEHVAKGVIRSARAKAALEGPSNEAAA